MQKHFLTTIVWFLLTPVFAIAATGSAGSVETMSGNPAGDRTADLRAIVSASVPGTVLSFEYGDTEALGRRSYTQSVAVGDARMIRQRIFNLTPGTTYFYRAVIESPAGTVYGVTNSFLSGLPIGGALAGNSSAVGATRTGVVSSGAQGATIASSGSGTGVSGSNRDSVRSTATNGATNADQLASVSASGETGDSTANAATTNPGGFFQRLFDALTAARPLQAGIAMTPKDPSERDIVEYVVTVTNASSKATGAGTIAVLIPDSIVYLGDNSGGRSVLSKTDGAQRLTVQMKPLEAKTRRTLTIMGVAGSAATAENAIALVDLNYVDAKGAVQRITTNSPVSRTAANTIASTQQTAQTSVTAASGASESSGGILPSSFTGWLVFLVVVTGAIVVLRRLTNFYQERKKKLLEDAGSSNGHGPRPAHA